MVLELKMFNDYDDKEKKRPSGAISPLPSVLWTSLFALWTSFCCPLDQVFDSLDQVFHPLDYFLHPGLGFKGFEGSRGSKVKGFNGFKGFKGFKGSRCSRLHQGFKGSRGSRAAQTSSKTNENTSGFNALAPLSGPPNIAQNHGLVVLRLWNLRPVVLFFCQQNQ